MVRSYLTNPADFLHRSTLSISRECSSRSLASVSSGKTWNTQFGFGDKVFELKIGRISAQCQNTITKLKWIHKSKVSCLESLNTK